MHGKVTRCAIVDAERVAAESTDLALNEHFPRLRRESGEMHLSCGILIPVFLHVRPARRPAGPQKHDGAFGNPAVALLPIFYTCGAQLKIGILTTLGAHINHYSRSEQL